MREIRIRILPTVLSGSYPIVSLRFLLQSSGMKISPPLRFAPADRLIILRQLDSLRKWESLDDQRFCRGCHKFIRGRQIEVIKGTRPNKQLRLVCPTDGCFSSTEDWAYPNEIANPPDGWGRRAIRVIDSNGERFIACGKRYGYSRRGPFQRLARASTPAA